MDSRGRTKRELIPSRHRRASHPLSIGTRMMVREASGRFYVNLGGIAEANSFCPRKGAEAFFVASSRAPGKNAGHLPSKITY